MDHKWGRDITVLGLGGTGATLVSRILEGPVTFYLTNEPQVAGHCKVWVGPPDTANGDWVGFAAPKKGKPNFPYGWDVEPDVLL